MNRVSASICADRAKAMHRRAQQAEGRNTAALHDLDTWISSLTAFPERVNRFAYTITLLEKLRKTLAGGNR